MLLSRYFTRCWFVAFIAFLWTAEIKADITLTFGDNANDNKEVSELITKNAKATSAIQAFRRGDLRGCEALLNEAYKDSTDLPKVDVMMGRLLIQNGQYMEAMARLENYLRTNDQDPEAHASLGEIGLRTGRLSDAWLQFRESLILLGNSTLSKSRRDDFTTRLTQLRAETAEARGDLDTAEKLFQELEKLIPKSGYPLWAQGRLQVRKDKLTQGFELLTKARERDKNLPQPELTMAMAVSGSTDPDKLKIAEKWFQDGIKKTESVTGANWFEYAKWLLSQDRADAARTLIKNSGQFRESFGMKFLDAYSLRFSDKIQEAELAFSALHDANPADPQVSDQLALILIDSPDQGKKLRAQQLAQTNLRRAPSEESAIATYAWIEFRLGTVDVADRILSELAARGPIGPQSAYYIGRILDAAGRTDEATGLFDVAVNTAGLFVQRNTTRELVKARKAKIPDGKKNAEAKGQGPDGSKKSSDPPAMKQDGKANDAKASTTPAKSDASSSKSTSQPETAKAKGQPETAKATEKSGGDSAKSSATTPPSVTPSAKK
jgi:predicted Zn-dependent protease